MVAHKAHNLKVAGSSPAPASDDGLGSQPEIKCTEEVELLGHSQP